MGWPSQLSYLRVFLRGGKSMMIDQATDTVYWVGKVNCFAAPIVNGRTDFKQKIPLERWQIKNEKIQERLHEVVFTKDDTDFDLKYLEKIRREKK